MQANLDDAILSSSPSVLTMLVPPEAQDGHHQARRRIVSWGRWGAATACWLLGLLPGMDASAGEPAPVSGYQRDLDELNSRLTGAASVLWADPPQPEEMRLCLGLLCRRASLTRSLADCRAARQGLERGFAVLGPSETLRVLRARLALSTHALDAARHDLETFPPDMQAPEVDALRAELAMQSGDYATVRRLCGPEEPAPGQGWDRLARRAALLALSGDTPGADHLYALAEDELTAREMSSYAWLEVQRGQLQLRRGLPREAADHFARAARAYPVCWWVEQQEAEALAAQGKSSEAIALYRKLLAREPRPEIQQELGDLYVFLGRQDEAKPWYERSLAAYLESAGAGEAMYLHHLSGLYVDGLGDGAAGLKWARADLAVRPGPAAHEALAWALFHTGQFAAGRDEIERALAFQIADTHLFYHAGMLFLACGQTDEGKKYLARGAEMNPRYLAMFHAHR
jgi:tetratricopeptide (TPR) repeat protein